VLVSPTSPTHTRTWFRWFRMLLAFMLEGYVVALVGYVLLRLFVGDGEWWLAWFNNFAPYYFLPLFLVLPIALSLHSKRTVVATLLLLGIGVGWLFPRFVRGNAVIRSDAEQEASLTVVTFNVWGANPQLDRVVAWLRETNADIVLLQEVPPVWAGVPIPQLNDLYPYQVSQSLEFRPWGDAILSQHPILVHNRYALEGDFASNERIEVVWNEQTVAIYNVHLSMPQRDDPHIHLPLYHPFLNMLLKYDDMRRNAQVDRLLGVLATEAYPFIVGGDFNMSDNAVKYGDIARQLRDAYRETGSGFGSTWPYAPVAGLPSFVPPLLRIDYIWHSAMFRTLHAATGPELGSDHFPVIAVLGRET